MTTTHTHTQGPWHVGAGNGEGSIFAENGRTRLEIGGTTLYPIARMGKGWNEEEDEANARLIAAAPEMLEALREMLSMFVDHEQYDEDSAQVISQTRQVLAKAEGRDA